MKPVFQYREYVYGINFSDPFKIFKGLKKFPQVLHHAVTSGSWNTLITTDRHLDFSKLVGFQSLVHQGVKRFTYTPKVEYKTWDEGIEQFGDQGARLTPTQAECKDSRLAPPSDWGEDEWKLYHAFKSNLRQGRTPIIRKTKVRYKIYSQWMDTLKDYCTIHVEFYPYGREKSMVFCFSISSKNDIVPCFSVFPTTCPIIKVEEKKNRFLVFPAVDSTEGIKELLSATCKMKTKETITEFSYSAILEDFFHLR